ncbi:hypothetical protein QAD02_010475 [Eretmocerus hayati]|uniref:Uncharacterized protein n=1 Tax=Eretmocerus hayati TaxID=131215 RepID=A0ACC2NWM5_9HYME|nr:hypothetical protein QAD02_010475 [Eretmocerus hayati]
MCPPSAGRMMEIDVVIRRNVKEILHLHETTNIPSVYTSRQYGGLGIANQHDMVYLSALRNGVKATSADPALRASMNQAKTVKKLEEYAQAVGLNHPITVEQK